jgi:hypothetical protein
MDKLQALAIIKEILDAASKSGLFQNLESSMTAYNAYNLINQELKKIDGPNTDIDSNN